MGSNTGSFINEQYGDMQSSDPVVGMGVTELGWTDRHAWTIITVHSSKLITIQRDRAIRTDTNGMSESQSYRFEADTAGLTRRLSLRKDGHWYQVGESMGSTKYMLGRREEYHDYSF